MGEVWEERFKSTADHKIYCSGKISQVPHEGHLEHVYSLFLLLIVKSLTR